MLLALFTDASAFKPFLRGGMVKVSSDKSAIHTPPLPESAGWERLSSAPPAVLGAPGKATSSGVAFAQPAAAGVAPQLQWSWEELLKATEVLDESTAETSGGTDTTIGISSGTNSNSSSIDSGTNSVIVSGLLTDRKRGNAPRMARRKAPRTRRSFLAARRAVEQCHKDTPKHLHCVCKFKLCCGLTSESALGELSLTQHCMARIEETQWQLGDMTCMKHLKGVPRVCYLPNGVLA